MPVLIFCGRAAAELFGTTDVRGSRSAGAWPSSWSTLGPGEGRVGPRANVVEIERAPSAGTRGLDATDSARRGKTSQCTGAMPHMGTIEPRGADHEKPDPKVVRQKTVPYGIAAGAMLRTIEGTSTRLQLWGGRLGAKAGGRTSGSPAARRGVGAGPMACHSVDWTQLACGGSRVTRGRGFPAAPVIYTRCRTSRLRSARGAWRPASRHGASPGRGAGALPRPPTAAPCGAPWPARSRNRGAREPSAGSGGWAPAWSDRPRNPFGAGGERGQVRRGQLAQARFRPPGP